MELPFSDTDVTIVMRYIAELDENVKGIRQLLEEDDGEEDLPEVDS